MVIIPAAFFVYKAFEAVKSQAATSASGSSLSKTESGPSLDDVTMNLWSSNAGFGHLGLRVRFVGNKVFFEGGRECNLIRVTEWGAVLPVYLSLCNHPGEPWQGATS